MRVNKLYMTLCAVVVASLVGCSNGGGSSSGSNNPVIPNSAITIDNAGTVPVLGNLQTQSVIYVHNNSNIAISNITFSAVTNTPESGATNATNLINTSACGSIPAGQSCPIGFTSPALSPTVAQASMVINANYQINNESRVFSNVLNFARVDNSSESGVVINTGVQLSGFGNTNAYGTVYAYGTGSEQVYNVTQLSNNNPGITITQGNISGRQIQSNFVQAIELTGQVPSSTSTNSVTKKVLAGIVSTLSLSSAAESVTAVTYTSTANVGVAPAATGAALTSGTIPLLNSATTTSGSIFIVNPGIEVATLGTPTLPDSVTLTGGSGACGSSLAPSASCILYFNVAANTGGSGTISLPYSSANVATATLSQNITWYSGASSAPLLMMSSSANPLTFNATTGGSNTITITNIGSIALSSAAATAPLVIGGSATATLGDAISCKNVSGSATGTNLPIGGSCTYTLNVNDHAAETGSVRYSISGAYASVDEFDDPIVVTYSRYNVFNYTATPYVASLSLSPNPIVMNTFSGGESAIKSVTITNTGPVMASIDNIYFGGGQYEYLTVESTTCGVKLEANSSCNATLQLMSPANQSTAITGFENFHVAYSGGQAVGAVASSLVNWTVLPNNEGLTASMSAIGSESGTGTSAEPYIFGGYVTSGQSVTLTLTNRGSNPVKVTNIVNNAEPANWIIDSANSTCYSNGNLPSAAIMVGNSCTIVYKSVITSSVSLGSVGVVNIALPDVTFMDTSTNTQFIENPLLVASEPTIYATSYQATMANSITQSGDNLIVVSQLTNAANYGAIAVTASMENYFTETPVAGSGCSVNSSGGITSQQCVLTPINGSAVGKVSYQLNFADYNGATLTSSFMENTNGQTISVFPQQVSITFNQLPHWSLLGAGYLFEAANSNMVFDSKGNLYTAFVSVYNTNDVWQWNGYVWNQIGSDIPAYQLNSVGIDHVGSLYTAGYDNLAEATVWKLNGSNWESVGQSIMRGSVTSIIFDHNNKLYAAVESYVGNVGSIWRWSGESWNEIGGGSLPDSTAVTSMVFNNGTLYVAGQTSSQTGDVYGAVWKLDGESWSLLANTVSSSAVINSIAFDKNGVLYAGGNVLDDNNFPRGGVWKWNGSQWSSVGHIINEIIFNAMVVDEHGNVYASGSNAAGYPGGGAAWKWNGSRWEAVGGGFIPGALSINSVALRDDILYVNGGGLSDGVWAFNHP